MKLSRTDPQDIGGLHGDSQRPDFFALSGEFEQSGKRGDIQALVLFTTPEVRTGELRLKPGSFIDNALGTNHGASSNIETMSEALHELLRNDLKVLSGGRQEIDLFWCDINRGDLGLTFERIANVLFAAKPPHSVGKEIWINLTGGGNIINMSLQLSAAIHGAPSRLYYTQADNITLARPSIQLDQIGTAKDAFWVEIPMIYLAFDRPHRVILEMLQSERQSDWVNPGELLKRLKGGSAWEDFQNTDDQTFKRLYLTPLTAQKLVERMGGSKHDDPIRIGPRWSAFKRFYEVIATLEDGNSKTLSQLATDEEWFHAEKISAR